MGTLAESLIAAGNSTVKRPPLQETLGVSRKRPPAWYLSRHRKQPKRTTIVEAHGESEVDRLEMEGHDSAGKASTSANEGETRPGHAASRAQPWSTAEASRPLYQRFRDTFGL